MEPAAIESVGPMLGTMINPVAREPAISVHDAFQALWGLKNMSLNFSSRKTAEEV